MASWGGVVGSALSSADGVEDWREGDPVEEHWGGSGNGRVSVRESEEGQSKRDTRQPGSCDGPAVRWAWMPARRVRRVEEEAALTGNGRG